MRILDATAGYRGIWYQKSHPYVTFMDNRKETFLSTHQNQKKRTYNINPDIVSTWIDAPFPDGYFDMIIFDPPHLIRKHETVESTMMKQYGYFYEENYKEIIKEGIDKLFRLLKPDGIFIFKWAETDKPVKEILPLLPYKPLFGTRTGQRTKVYWILILKDNISKNHEEKG